MVCDDFRKGIRKNFVLGGNCDLPFAFGEGRLQVRNLCRKVLELGSDRGNLFGKIISTLAVFVKGFRDFRHHGGSLVFRSDCQLNVAVVCHDSSPVQC